MKPRRGFTIVELLIVIGIISVLMTLAVSAVTGAIKSARKNRAEACCKVVQQGLAAYYAQKAKWPKIETESLRPSYADEMGTVDVSDKSDEMIGELVKEAQSGNVLFDVSVLYVSNSTGEKARGRDFSDAVRAGEIPTHFGYQDPETGYFRRFKIIYSILGDAMTVSMQ